MTNGNSWKETQGLQRKEKLQHHKTPNQFTDRRITRKYVKTLRLNLTPSIADSNHKWREKKVLLFAAKTHALPSARQAYIAILTSNSILIFPLALTKWTIPHRLHTSIPIPIPTPHAQQHPDETKPEIEHSPSPPPPRSCLHYSPTVESPIFSCHGRLFFFE